MTANVQGFTFTRPSHRMVRLIWIVLAVAALAATATVIVLMTAATRHHPQPTGTTFGGFNPNLTSNACVPTRVIHPC